ncbi:CC/Se motif family (seleno)protein [Anaerospora sp.]|uniref:CC/Se motif family (seleno)protein n=1 Tax=Anaerospora sp. TaxID=1960278 RepID=UPI00289F959B|nr:CC/Se motif family (seleno)protein [Anaerospora sp.]
MFIVEQAAAQYINKRSGSVVVSLKLEPAMGGCACSTQHITGSYLPVITLGPPTEPDQYNRVSIEDITVFYAPNIQPKADYPSMVIRVKKMLFWSWLEIEGAKPIASYK